MTTSDGSHSLKLYVVGERSGNPDDWDEDTTSCLVFAESADQARALVGDWPVSDAVAEVKPSASGVIDFHSPPAVSFS
jgi:hypothetical protein